MRCDQFEKRLQRRLDQRVQPEDDVPLQTHAEQCGACRRLMQSQAILFAGLRHSTPTVHLDTLADGVACRLDRPRSHSYLRRLVPLAASVGLVCCSLGLFWVLTVQGRAGRGDAVGRALQPDRLPRRSSVSQGHADQLATVSPVGHGAVPSDDALAALVWRGPLAAERDLQLQWSKLASRWHGIHKKWDLSQRLETHPWVDQLTGSLRPLATSVSSALSLVRSSIDGGKGQPPSEAPQAHSWVPVRDGRASWA